MIDETIGTVYSDHDDTDLAIQVARHATTITLRPAGGQSRTFTINNDQRNAANNIADAINECLESDIRDQYRADYADPFGALLTIHSEAVFATVTLSLPGDDDVVFTASRAVFDEPDKLRNAARDLRKAAIKMNVDAHKPDLTIPRPLCQNRGPLVDEKETSCVLPDGHDGQHRAAPQRVDVRW